MKPKIGVLITYFNERDLLRECLDSLETQSTRPDEIIIYDDASDFPAEEYVPKGFSAKVIHGEVNKGPSYGRNILLHVSQSDYVHFHDTDDLFHPNWCQRVRQAIEETNVDAVFTEISTYSENQLISYRVVGFEDLIDEKDFIHFCIRHVILTDAGTYRRSLVLDIGGYRESLAYSEDFDFHVRLAAKGVSYKIISDPLIVKRSRPSAYSRDNLKNYTSVMEAIRMLSEELSSEYYGYLAEAAARAGSVLFRLGARREAREAFRFASKLGPIRFSEQQFLYRILAKLFNPECAEQAGSIYRKIFSEKLRHFLTRKLR